MRGQAGSRKRISFNNPRETLRIVLLLCLLATVAAFAASRDKTALRVYARTTQPVQAAQAAPISRSTTTSRPNFGQSIAASPAPRQPATATKPKQPATVVANVQPLPFTETTSFRLLWLTAGFGLVILLRCHRRRA